MSHPQFIVGIKNESLMATGLKQGLNVVDINMLSKIVQSSIVIGERAALEKDQTVRQVLPYVILSQFDESAGCMKYVPYRRTKMVGESRLAGNVSVGFGGHIDLADVYHENSVVDLIATIGHSLNRELDEEVEFSIDGKEPSEEDAFELSLLNVGIIIDDSNEVGKVHMGVVINGQLPAGFSATCAEKELESMEMMTASELLNSGLPLENWTRIALEHLEAMEHGE